jgi:predicted nucleic acid-binding protein
MEQMVNSETRAQTERPNRELPLVFLDSNVLIAFLRGDQAAVQLFSAEADGKVRFAVNPIVLQELLLAADATTLPKFDRIRDHLEILPLDIAKAEALLPILRELRNRMAHSNDVLILSSADGCDFLVTRDALLKNLVTTAKPRVVTPEELITHLRAA